MSRAQGRSVGLPKSSWFHQLPQRPIPWASSTPGATASMKTRTLWPERRTTTAPAIVPSRIPPQTPSPPFHTANGPHHASGISSQLVMSWYARAPTTPNATPQTATRRMRSQSPPRRTQRTPVRTMQAAIASSSIRPYMWIVSGPMSIVLVCGEGMKARVTGRTFCPPAPRPADDCGLDQDVDRQLVRTAVLDEADREVEIDVVPGGKRDRVARVVTGPHELLGTPVLDPFHLVLRKKLELNRRHVLAIRSRAAIGSPLSGGSVMSVGSTGHCRRTHGLGIACDADWRPCRLCRRGRLYPVPPDYRHRKRRLRGIYRIARASWSASRFVSLPSRRRVRSPCTQRRTLPWIRIVRRWRNIPFRSR